ncbi:MAG: carboxypeptidase regulatory-like domain-containing protein [Kofleriaceae bacterium]
MKRKTWFVVAGAVVVLAIIAAGLLLGRDDGAAPVAANAPAVAEGPAQARRVERAKAEPASIAGRVTRARDGTGIAGSVVSLTSASPGELFQASDRSPIVALTDETGEWTAQVPAGIYAIAAQAQGFLPTSRPRLALAPGQHLDRIDLALEPGGTLVSGTVSDVGGGGIEGAQVELQRSHAMLSGDASRLIAIANADGRYQITLPDGTWSATASHDDYASETRDFAVTGAPLDIDFVLTPGGVIRGRVIARGDGKPVPGARVDAMNERLVVGDAYADATTDADGRFVLRGLAPGGLSIRARASGLGTAAPTIVHLGVGEQLEDVVLVVDRAFSISGRVVEGGKPNAGVPGVNVAATAMATGQYAGALEVSAEDGSFEIVAVEPGTYTLVAFGEGYMPDLSGSVSVVDRDVTGVVIELATGATLSGRVQPGTVATIGLELGSDATVLGNLFDSIKAGMARAESDETGAFTLRGVPDGAFQLRATTTDGRKGLLPIQVAGRDQRDLVVELAAQASLSGRVVDARGAAVAGVRVRAEAARGARGFSLQIGEETSQAVTSADGRFRLVGLDAGKVEVRVYDELGMLAWADRPASREPIELELAKEVAKTGVTLVVEARDGKIRGRVVGADGKPAADAWVTARPHRGTEDDALRFDEAARPVLSGPDGAFAIERLRHGTYDLVAEGDKGRARGEQTGVQTGGHTTISLAPLGTLTGRVRVGAQPAPATDIACELPSQTAHRTTSTGGTYALARLAPGTYQCTARGNAGTATGSVVVSAGAAALDLVLQPWASLTGTVTDATTGEPIAGLLVATDVSGMMDIMLGSAPTTDARGRFVVERVAPGPGTLMVMERGSMGPRATASYELVAGQRLDLGTISANAP